MDGKWTGIAILGSVTVVLAILLGFTLVRGHEPGWRHVPYGPQVMEPRGWAAGRPGVPGACPLCGMRMMEGMPGGMGRMRSMMSPLAMDVVDGVLFVATADALTRIEAKDLKVAKTVELPAAEQAAPMHGPIGVRIAQGSVYVSRAGWVYRFNAETLALEAKRELPSGTPARPTGAGPE